MTTTNKSLYQPAQGSLNWDDPLNTNFGWIDDALGTDIGINVTGISAKTLTVDEYRCMAFNVTGNMSGNTIITIPSGIGGTWIVYNNTTDAVAGSNHTVTFASGGGGTSVVVNRGRNTTIWSDGSNIRFADNASLPGGVNKSVQFNDSGSFGGESDFVYDKATNRLGVGVASPSYNLQVNASGTADANFGIVAPSTSYRPIMYFTQTSGNTWFQGLTTGAAAGDFYFGLGGNVGLRVGASGGDVDYYRFYTQSATAFYISSTGRVAVGGSTSPDAIIDVETDASTTPMLRLYNTNATDLYNRIQFWGPSNNSYNNYAEIRSKIISKGSNTPTAIQGSLEFYTTNAISNTSTFRAIIDEDGNFGIGDATPDYKLTVYQSNPTRGVMAQLRNFATSSQTGSLFNFTTTGIGEFAIGMTGTENAFSIWSGRNVSADGTRIASFSTTGFAIGPDLPSSAGIYVYSATSTGIEVESNAAPSVTVTRHSTDANAPYLYLDKTRNTKASPSNTAAGDNLGIVEFSGYGGGRVIGAQIRAVQTTTSTNTPTRLGFYVKPNSATAVTEQMRLDDDGQLYFNSGYGSLGEAYACRAWANFSGTSATIRKSGNVASITLISTGLYRVNLTTAMPDTNYAAIVSGPGVGNNVEWLFPTVTSTLAVGSYNIYMQVSGAGTGPAANSAYLYTAVFR